MKLLIFFIKIASLLSAIAGLSANNETLKVEKNITNSTTEITAPAEKCPMFMSLYPTNENSTEWICDCTFNYYLYYSETDSCYSAYERGPCPSEHYLVLPPGEHLAKCEKNPCLEEGLVPFKGGCYRLWKSGPHCFLNGFLTIHPEDFALVCTFQRNLNIITAPTKTCPSGSRRNTVGQCKKIHS